MDSENKYWLCILSLAASFLTVVTLCVVADSIISTNTVKEMVAAGIDPIKARCAVYGSQNDEAICRIATMEQKK